MTDAPDKPAPDRPNLEEVRAMLARRGAPVERPAEPQAVLSEVDAPEPNDGEQIADDAIGDLDDAASEDCGEAEHAARLRAIERLLDMGARYVDLARAGLIDERGL